MKTSCFLGLVMRSTCILLLLHLSPARGARCRLTLRRPICSLSCLVGIGRCRGSMVLPPDTRMPPQEWKMVRLYDDGKVSHWGQVHFPFTRSQPFDPAAGGTAVAAAPPHQQASPTPPHPAPPTAAPTAAPIAPGDKYRRKICANGSHDLLDRAHAKVCSRCRLVWYCNELCQQQDWRRSHMKVCRTVIQARSTIADAWAEAEVNEAIALAAEMSLADARVRPFLPFPVTTPLTVCC